jgi:aryl-alcohol dehydrogenase-like predicted oxidoreductase
MASKIPQRRLGKDGPLVPAMSFGLMMFAGVYGAAPDDEGKYKILDRALEIGATLWDTAEYVVPVLDPSLP